MCCVACILRVKSMTVLQKTVTTLLGIDIEVCKKPFFPKLMLCFYNSQNLSSFCCRGSPFFHKIPVYLIPLSSCKTHPKKEKAPAQQGFNAVE